MNLDTFLWQTINTFGDFFSFKIAGKQSKKSVRNKKRKGKQLE
jgi:hypothetical protein